MKEGLSYLEAQSEHDFLRPSGDTDKLYMPIGEKDLIEVAHPQPRDATDSWYFFSYVDLVIIYLIIMSFRCEIKDIILKSLNQFIIDITLTVLYVKMLLIIYLIIGLLLFGLKVLILITILFS